MTIKLDNQNKRNFAIKMTKCLSISEQVAYEFLDKAHQTRIIKGTNENDLNEWFTNNFRPNMFSLGHKEYVEAAVQSLKIQKTIASTDYGSSRQRDFGQKWSDTIRGYLGELGIRQLLQKRFKVEITLGHEKGDLKEFLDCDIKTVKTPLDNDFRDPKKLISIKTIKSNGIWLDIPGAQINHSDIFIVASIGVDKDHLFSFFKKLPIFDAIFKEAEKLSLINKDDFDNILSDIPDPEEIIGYVPGFHVRPNNMDDMSYDGQMGINTYTITNYKGKNSKENLETIKSSESSSEKECEKVKFSGIGEFANEDKFIFGIGELSNREDDWKKIILNQI